MNKRHKDCPKVSVIISTYDRANLLDRALASVHAQTFNDFEVIIADDCSSKREELRTVLEKWEPQFAARDIEFYAFSLEENSGYQCAPKNRGIEQSRGDYIAYLDDDNEWYPEHLQVAVDAIESDFSTDMVYTRLYYVIDGDEVRKKLKKAFNGNAPEGETVGQSWNPQLLLERNYVDTSSILHSKGAFWRLVRDTGYGWDEALRRFGDWNFVWRWAVFGNSGKFVDVPTVRYHWTDTSMQLTRSLVEAPISQSYQQFISLRSEVENSSHSGQIQTK